MTKGLIYFLEMVQIHEQQRQNVAGALGAGDGVLEPIPQQIEIGQLRQRIMGRLIDHLLG